MDLHFTVYLITCHICVRGLTDSNFSGPEFLACSFVHIGEGNGTPLQYSCLANPMDGGAWKAAVHGVTESQTRLSDFTFIFHFHALEKEMATHFSVLAWRIPGTGEPSGLPSMGSHRVRHNWSDLAAAAAAFEHIEGLDMKWQYSSVPEEVQVGLSLLDKQGYFPYGGRL